MEVYRLKQYQLRYIRQYTRICYYWLFFCECRLDIICCISKVYEVSKIASNFEAPRWTILGDLKRMQHNRYSKLKDAHSKARERVLLRNNLPEK